MLRPAEPAGPEPVESEASRRRGLMIVETAMELAGTGGCLYGFVNYGGFRFSA